MLKKGSLFSVVIVFLLLVIGCSPPDTMENSSYNQPVPPSIQAPIANAGSDQTILITEVSTVYLDGSGSYDPDGSVLNYLWISVDDTITFGQANRSISPTVSLPTAPGDYFFVLIVDDGVNYSQPDIVTITVIQPDARVDSELLDDNPSESKFKSIQSAIDAISDGTDKIIAVINGPYYEKISIKANIHLIGLKPSSLFTPEMPQIIYENDLAYRNAVVSLQNNAVLENFEITCKACTYCNDCRDDATAKAAINVEGVNTTIKKCSIIGSDNSSFDGIWIKENMSAMVTESEIKEVAGEGIQLEAGSELVVENSLISKTGGSSIWARDCDFVEVNNSISYHAGWHGFDFSGCNKVTVEHCTIVDFSGSDRCQSGIFVKCGNTSLKSNLIEIRGTLNGVAYTTLRGIVYNEADNPCTPENENITCTSSNLTYLNNYIYTKQDIETYYGGEIATEPVDSSNHPTSNDGTTSDPLLINPDMGDFRLNQDSPAIGLGENDSNPGANGTILNPST